MHFCKTMMTFITKGPRWFYSAHLSLSMVTSKTNRKEYSSFTHSRAIKVTAWYHLISRSILSQNMLIKTIKSIWLKMKRLYHKHGEYSFNHFSLISPKTELYLNFAIKYIYLKYEITSLKPLVWKHVGIQ